MDGGTGAQLHVARRGVADRLSQLTRGGAKLQKVLSVVNRTGTADRIDPLNN
jgi:hypothetical protein